MTNYFIYIAIRVLLSFLAFLSLLGVWLDSMGGGD